MNKQRETIYGIRRSALEEKTSAIRPRHRRGNRARTRETFCPREQHPDQWNTTQFLAERQRAVRHRNESCGRRTPATLSHDQLCRAAPRPATKRYEEKKNSRRGPDALAGAAASSRRGRFAMEDHLLSLDHLKRRHRPARLRAKRPHRGVQKEASRSSKTDGTHRHETIRYLFHIQGAAGRAAASVRRNLRPRRSQRVLALIASPPAPRRAGEPQHLPAVAREIERRHNASKKICSIRRARAG